MGFVSFSSSCLNFPLNLDLMSLSPTLTIYQEPVDLMTLPFIFLSYFFADVLRFFLRCPDYPAPASRRLRRPLGRHPDPPVLSGAVEIQRLFPFQIHSHNLG